jgi:hypothetical protein
MLGVEAIPAFAGLLCRLPAEVRCIEIIFPGNTHQGEERIAPGVGEPVSNEDHQYLRW